MVIQAFQPPLSWQSVDRMVLLSHVYVKCQQYNNTERVVTVNTCSSCVFYIYDVQLKMLFSDLQKGKTTDPFLLLAM